MKTKITVILFGIFLLNSCIITTVAILSTKGRKKKEIITYEQVETLTKDAYVYCFPIVKMYKTIYYYGVAQQSPHYAPINTVQHKPKQYNTQNTLVGSDNETYYVAGILDVRAEPVLIKIPETQSSSYSFQLIDMKADNFLHIKANTTGMFAITSPHFSGQLPKGVQQIKSSSEIVILTAREHENTDKPTTDSGEVNNLRNNYQVGVISRFYPDFKRETVEPINFPPFNESYLESKEYFGLVNFLLQYITFTDNEQKIINSFIKIGVMANEPYLFYDDNPNYQAYISNGIKNGIAKIESLSRALKLATKHK